MSKIVSASINGVRAVMIAALTVFASALTSSGATANDDLIWTTGRVLGAEGRPVVGAIVAAYDDQNKIVDYARTDRNGEYALALPKRALHLDKHTQGFFANVMSTATRFGGDTVGFVTNPVRQGVQAITSAEASTVSDPITKGEFAAGGAIAGKVLGMITPPRHSASKIKNERTLPGALMLKVVAPQTNDLVDVNRIYWMQSEELHVAGKTRHTIAAWLDPVKLAMGGADEKSKVESDYLKFTHVRLEPSLAEPGQKIHLSTKLIIPPDPHVDVVVVARHTKTGATWEMHPAGGDTYETDIVVDKRFVLNDQTICVLAYAELHEKPGRRKDVEKAIESAGMWDPTKSFVYDPLLVVSRNRAETTLTVLQPEKHKH